MAVLALTYGCKPGEARFAAFAASDRGEWLDTVTLLDDPTLPTVPVLYRGPFDPDVVLPLAEANSTVPGACDVGRALELLRGHATASLPDVLKPKAPANVVAFVPKPEKPSRP